jgi:hydroxyethylthiazole kinase-like uncharacterized protein yjeF
MRPLVSPQVMARADAAAIDAGTPAEVLMDRAGRAVARAAMDVAGGRYGRRAVVVCGKGSNGGDGFAAARVLGREGLHVRCLSLVEPGAVRGAARYHLDRLLAEGGLVKPFDEVSLQGADVVVDAIFGTGFRGRVSGPAAGAIQAINRSDAPVVAVDVPSGVDGLTGAASSHGVRARVTVVMGAEKYGTAVGHGSVLAGRVSVADIGIRVETDLVAMAEPDDVHRVLPRRLPDAHKRSGGAVAVLAGSDGMSGAALLTCRGAVRMGAGYATLGSTPSVVAAKAVTLPEVLSETVADAGVLGPDALDRFSSVLERVQALALGPGLGRGFQQRNLVAHALEGVSHPLVVDADALNALVQHTQPLERRTGPTVLTPHPAELARLLDVGVPDISANRLDAAQRAAERFGSVVLLKGWRTVVSGPGGRAVVNPTGGPELATAGTGDVLTGAVAALLAAGLDPFEAAWAAAFVHGEAGSLAGRGSPAGVVAWDVAEALPKALRRHVIESEDGAR